MATFNSVAWMSGAVAKMLEEDSGGFKNFDDMLIKLRKTLATSRRRAVEKDLSSIGSGGVQSTAQLFAPGTREVQAGEAEVDAVSTLTAENERMKSARRAEAERVAAAQLPIAYAEFQRANQPSGLSKIAGAVVGGLASTFIPMAGAALAQTVFPKLFPQAASATAAPAPSAGSSTPVSMLGGPTTADPMNPFSSTINWEEFMKSNGGVY